MSIRTLPASFILLSIFAGFLLLRGPVMYRQPGGQDEDCYAIPGLTILQDGLPRLPHAPAKNPESVFFHADQMLYAEPPLFFYVQSLFYAVLSDTYGTARLCASIIGFVAATLLFGLNRQYGGSDRAGLWAIGLFVFSRWFYFPAMSARPDLLCTAFGFATILCMTRWTKTHRTRWLIATGASIGAGGMTHPFALVYGVQMAVWAMVASRSWNRLINPALLTITAMSIASLWIPLIAMYPQTFAVQFTNQFLGNHGDSLLYRIVMPWSSLWYHSLSPPGMLNHIGLWQVFLVGGPLVICIFWWHAVASPLVRIAWLAVSSMYLMSVLVGSHHPVIGYWSYTAGLMFICTGHCIDVLFQRIYNSQSTFRPLRPYLTFAMTSVLVISLIPGGGLKTLLAHFRHWDDTNYNAPVFAKKLADSLPPDSLIAVDTEFLLDFLVHHRNVLLAQMLPAYFRLEQFPFDYLIVSRYGMDTGIAKRLNVELLRTIGNKDDEFACYAEIYRRRHDHQDSFPPK